MESEWGRGSEQERIKKSLRRGALGRGVRSIFYHKNFPKEIMKLKKVWSGNGCWERGHASLPIVRYLRVNVFNIPILRYLFTTYTLKICEQSFEEHNYLRYL